MRYYWVSLSYAKFLIAGDIYVKETAPIAAWLMKKNDVKTMQWALRYFRNKGARIAEITNPQDIRYIS